MNYKLYKYIVLFFETFHNMVLHAFTLLALLLFSFAAGILLTHWGQVTYVYVSGLGQLWYQVMTCHLVYAKQLLESMPI